MEFFLPFKIQDYPFKISYSDNILFIGSCFSKEIGNKLKELKFNVLQNPNGILYDPLSICDSLFSYIDNKPFDEKNIFKLNGLWHSWNHHSEFSGISKIEVLEKINQSVANAHTFLKESKYLVITLGTAFTYQLKPNNENVANCHKVPANHFEKKLIPTDEIIAQILGVLNAIEKFNPDLRIIFTVSPVKHVKDGIVENNRSKARLIEAVQSIVEQNSNAYYFPSYELVTDILRDYRFYKNDLVHPNETAINFVFEKFIGHFIDDPSKEVLEKIRKVMAAINHKPFFKESLIHKKFISAQLEIIAEIEAFHTFIDLSEEIKYFRN